MDSVVVVLVLLAGSFVSGAAMGYIAGVTRGMAIAQRLAGTRKNSPLPWILCFVGAAVMFVVALGSSVYTCYFLSKSARTTGTVTNIIEKTDKDGQTSAFPVFEYRSADGTAYTQESSMSDGRQYSKGDQFPVRYLPDSPQDARIDAFIHHWFLPILSGCTSIFLLCLGAGLRWWRSRDQGSSMR